MPTVDRMERVLRRLQQRAPVLSNAENCALRELKDVDGLLTSYTSRIKMVSESSRVASPAARLV